MSTSIVMIHINDSLSGTARSSLEDALGQLAGVTSPEFAVGKEHLLLVAYDTEITRSAALLEKTRAAGYTAQLVGI